MVAHRMISDGGVLGKGPVQTVCMEEKGHCCVRVDLAVQKSEPYLQAEQVSSALNLLRHESTGATQSSSLARGRPVKIAVF